MKNLFILFLLVFSFGVYADIDKTLSINKAYCGLITTSYATGHKYILTLKEYKNGEYQDKEIKIKGTPSSDNEKPTAGSFICLSYDSNSPDLLLFIYSAATRYNLQKNGEIYPSTFVKIYDLCNKASYNHGVCEAYVND